MAESIYWLKIISRTYDSLEQDKLRILIQEAKELDKILGSIVKNVKT